MTTLPPVAPSTGRRLQAPMAPAAVYTVKVWATDDEFIDQAMTYAIDSEKPVVPMFGKLLDGQDCDEFSWHVDPTSKQSWTTAASQECVATPDEIEKDQAKWLNNPAGWCPTQVAAVVSVQDARDHSHERTMLMWLIALLFLCCCCCLFIGGLVYLFRNKLFGKKGAQKSKRSIPKPQPAEMEPIMETRAPPRQSELLSPMPTTSVQIPTYQQRSVNVQVPPGMFPGQEVVAQTPEGGVVRAAIPEGFMPGMILNVTY